MKNRLTLCSAIGYNRGYSFVDLDLLEVIFSNSVLFGDDNHNNEGGFHASR